MKVTKDRNERESYYSIRFLSARASAKLLNGEEAISVCVTSFTDDLSTPYIAVGTAIIIEDEDTPKFGRIILLRYKDGQLNMITEREINGAPYAMLPYHDKLLVSVGNTVGKEISLCLNLFFKQFRFDCIDLKIKN
jgi:hypothetical protein